MPGARIDSGERVTLRTLESEDIPFLQRAYTNPEIRYPLGTPLKNLDQLEEWNDEGTDQFLVCLDGDDAGPGQPGEEAVKPIGVVSAEDASWRRPELVYWLVPEVHGDSYGNEAVSLVIDYVFRVYDTPAVGAGAYEFNEASRGLLESLGFAEEGRTHKNMFIDGEYRDTVQYYLLREEWQSE
ncbi:GNAT family N-acetyltransferase [Haladaptatus sp. DFWS20]|uniref:GNAT family N-acetyltransferase n=1 Tax=Haladaptatus sp. DFWS20 TaxID=3403467 RepID=UPI003EB808F8